MQVSMFKLFMDTHKVFVYRNLSQDCWSVKQIGGEHGGRVIFHADYVLLDKADFTVSEAGRQRVINEKRKNVHAGVVGRLISASITNERYPISRMVSYTTDSDPNYKYVDDADEVSYNPYKGKHFYFKDTGEDAVVNDDQLVVLSRDRKVFVM